MNDLELPPRRSLPPEVRDRIRGVTDSGFAEPSRRQRHRGPLAVAAGVAVLAAGAVMVTQSTGDRSGTVTTPPTTSTTSASATTAPSPLAQDALNRCWAVLNDRGDTPAPDPWRWVVDQQSPGVYAVAAMAGSQPVFCQVTANTVTVTDPDRAPVYAPGTRTAVLLHTAEGVIAGVADPAWTRVGLLIDDSDGRTAAPTIQEKGLFLWNGDDDAVDATIEVYPVVGDNHDVPGSGARVPLAQTPAPIVVVDRPGAASPEDVQQINLCAGATGHDPAGWTPGAALDVNGDRLTLALKDDQIVSCYYRFKPPGYTRTSLQTSVGPGVRRVTGLPHVDLPVQPVIGRVPDSVAYVYVEVYFGQQKERAVVVGSMFMVVPPSSAPVTKIQGFDTENTLVWEGPLSG